MNTLPKFKNSELLKLAFIHRSFLNETKEKLESNERLEFLGDSILSFIISEYLYNTYPDYDEGILTNLRSLVVNTKNLADVARKLEFGNELLLSRGEEESKGRQNESILANCFEAFVGALFLDQGIVAARDFLIKVIVPQIETFVKSKAFKDPKSMLQEFVQSKRGNSPVYKVLNEEGPPHARTFTMGVYVHNELIAKGTGRSKQLAEEEAAKHALEKTAQE